MKPIMVNNQFRIDYKLGEGGFGLVYAGIEIATGRPVALKMMPMQQDTRMLRDEAGVYAALAGGVGIPAVLWCGDETEYWVLAHEQLGPSLEDLLCYCGRRFSLKTLLLLADQAVARLAHVHARGYLHRDVKPENLLMGMGAQGNVLYLIDFGLAVERREPSKYTYLHNRPFGGTARYATLNNHKGQEQSWGDDLESLGYVLIYCANGSLPWMGLDIENERKRNEKIGQIKTSLSVEELCKGLPSEFAQYIEYVRSLGYEDKPDYVHLRRLFGNLFKARGFKHDNVYDWTEKLFHELHKMKAEQQNPPPPKPRRVRRKRLVKTW